MKTCPSIYFPWHIFVISLYLLNEHSTHHNQEVHFDDEKNVFKRFFLFPFL
jgi:hypothetical protein